MPDVYFPVGYEDKRRSPQSDNPLVFIHLRDPVYTPVYLLQCLRDMEIYPHHNMDLRSREHNDIPHLLAHDLYESGVSAREAARADYIARLHFRPARPGFGRSLHNCL